MCFLKEWKTGTLVTKAYKVFSVKNGKLFPMKSEYNIGKSYEIGSWLKCSDIKGFHCFISRENAIQTKELCIEMQRKYPNQFPSDNFVVKEVEIKEITIWGFALRNREDFERYFLEKIEPTEPNSIRALEIKIIE